MGLAETGHRPTQRRASIQYDFFQIDTIWEVDIRDALK